MSRPYPAHSIVHKRPDNVFALGVTRQNCLNMTYEVIACDRSLRGSASSPFRTVLDLVRKFRAECHILQCYLASCSLVAALYHDDRSTPLVCVSQLGFHPAFPEIELGTNAGPSHLGHHCLVIG